MAPNLFDSNFRTLNFDFESFIYANEILKPVTPKTNGNKKQDGQKTVCKHWLIGICFRNQCSYLHTYDFNNMPICPTMKGMNYIQKIGSGEKKTIAKDLKDFLFMSQLMENGLSYVEDVETTCGDFVVAGLFVQTNIFDVSYALCTLRDFVLRDQIVSKTYQSLRTISQYDESSMREERKG
ncbi:4736_t:CDS:2, partial [Dentiscutata erythropus]